MGVLNDIFGGGGKIPSFNPTPLRDILNKGANTQKGIVTNLPGQLEPFSTTLQNKTNQLGTGFTANAAERSRQLQAGAVNPTATSAAVGAKQEQAFRSVPLQQQAIREALASTGRLQTGRAGNALAAPVLQAAQETSDFGNALNLENERNRQDALKTGISMEQQADLAKLGLDTDTMRSLFETGRGDIVQQAAEMLGIEGDLSQGLFNLENTKQLSDISSAQANADRRSALRNALLGIGGQLAGVGIGKMIPQATAAPKV